MNAKKHFKSISIIGAGNVGHNFGLAFRQAGYLIHEIYSRTHASALLLSQTLNCQFTTDLSQLSDKSDLLVLAVNDDALADVINQIDIKDKPIVHTSGSTSIDIFKDHGFSHYGIFYPVQSFSKNETESLEPIPICVEGNTEETESLMLSFARSVSNKVYSMDSEKRKALHIAAVFANNFTNHMFHIADQLLSEHKISFEVIRPLLEKTAGKIRTEKPIDAQTGPAVRNDQNVIENHIDYLSDKPDFQELYELITNNIIKTQQGK